MASLKLKLKVNPGRHGAPLGKLSAFYQDINRFLRSVADDLGIALDSDFIVSDFSDGSVVCNAESVGHYGIDQSRLFDSEIEALLRHDPETKWRGRLGLKTLSSYCDIGSHLDSDEHLEFGFFDASNDVDWQSLTKKHTNAIAETITQFVSYHGAVFGKIQSLLKESKEPHFTLREITTQELVNCYYSSEDYDQVVHLLSDRNAYVHVSGTIKSNLVKRTIERIDAQRFQSAPSFSYEKLRNFIGAAPGLTGELDTPEYLRKIRGGEDA